MARQELSDAAMIVVEAQKIAAKYNLLRSRELAEEILKLVDNATTKAILLAAKVYGDSTHATSSNSVDEGASPEE